MSQKKELQKTKVQIKNVFQIFTTHRLQKKAYNNQLGLFPFIVIFHDFIQQHYE